MSGKLLTAKIDVTKIDKSKLFTGAKGTYLDLSIWINDTPDQFGNDVSIEQRTEKGAAKIYLGNGKTYKPKDAQQSSEPQRSKGQFDDDPTGLPF